jgi:single-strand DNA-binding protein
MNLTNFQLLTGHLGKDPELKTFDNGGKVCEFTLATNEVWKNKEGEKVTETTWHKCQAWNKTAELIYKFFKKGSGITVQGSKRVRTYQDKDGNNKFDHFTKVENFTFPLTEKREAVISNSTPPANEPGDDLPF